MSTEAERAALWREQRENRRQWARDNAAAMQGDPDVIAEIRAGWEPVVAANRERGTTEPLPEERHDREVWTPA